jgi:hypothetical protein
MLANSAAKTMAHQVAAREDALLTAAMQRRGWPIDAQYIRERMERQPITPNSDCLGGWHYYHDRQLFLTIKTFWETRSENGRLAEIVSMRVEAKDYAGD